MCKMETVNWHASYVLCRCSVYDLWQDLWSVVHFDLDLALLRDPTGSIPKGMCMVGRNYSLVYVCVLKPQLGPLVQSTIALPHIYIRVPGTHRALPTHVHMYEVLVPMYMYYVRVHSTYVLVH